MIDRISRMQVADILDKMQFFQGQRVGRELWNEKPVEVQEMDLENFNKDIRTIRDYILQLEEMEMPKVGEWIPIGQYPSEPSLLCLDNGHMAVGYYDYDFEEWTSNTVDGLNVGVTQDELEDGDPIAWMPLPEPYKE